MTDMLKLNNLTVTYQRHPALHHVNVGFETGSLTAIAGPNGAGKSTMLKSILGLIDCDSGTIQAAVHADKIAYLPQQAHIDVTFPITVLDCILLGYWKKVGLGKSITTAQVAKAEAALAAVGLSGFNRRVISSLSVGQLQRVLFARILVQDASLILLDEPFNAIDARTTKDLLKIIQQWHAEGRTVIAVLHDHAQIRQYFPQCVLLARHLIASGNTDDVLCHSNLHKANMMAEAIPDTVDICTEEAVQS